MKIAVGSEETRLKGKACKCLSRNPVPVNDLNGVVSSTSVRYKSSITQLLNVESKSLEDKKIIKTLLLMMEHKYRYIEF